MTLTDSVGLIAGVGISKQVKELRKSKTGSKVRNEAKRFWNDNKGMVDLRKSSKTIVPNNSQFPQTRLDIHNDLIGKGYHTTGTTDKGYVVYKDGNGHIVTIKPSGEVIPTTRMPVDPKNTSSKAPMYNQRTYYNGTIIPDELYDNTT